jgi:general secretion pathway protein G
MSLVEVMVVIAIILTLMSILAYGVFSIFTESKVGTSRLQMMKIAERVDVYMLRKKKPPSTGDGLGAVYGTEPVPSDSWGNEYVYVSPGPNGKPYDLISLGADGQEGGEGNDADIKLSEPE